MYEALCSWSNLVEAWQRASLGKRGKRSPAAFEYRLEDELCALQAELRAESYRPGGYRSFYVHEPKRRLISAAPFRDRVVHHALCNLIAPIFERSFVADSYANRVGRGTHRALDAAQHHARLYAYVLACDIRQYFPSIDHAILQEILARKIPDARVRGLIGSILESGRGVLSGEYNQRFFKGDDLFAALRPRGLPIGNLTSQLWANCYLNGFDHFVKRELRCPGYVRYVDDFLLFGDEKRDLWVWKAAVEERLAGLRLTIHPGAQPRPTRAGFAFLGFQVFPRRRRLKRRKGIHFQRKLRGLVNQWRRQEIQVSRLTASVKGWVNHARYGNTVGLRKAVLRSAFRADGGRGCVTLTPAGQDQRGGRVRPAADSEVAVRRSGDP